MSNDNVIQLPNPRVAKALKDISLVETPIADSFERAIKNAQTKEKAVEIGIKMADALRGLEQGIRFLSKK